MLVKQTIFSIKVISDEYPFIFAMEKFYHPYNYGFIYLLTAGNSFDDLPPPCDSLIYCHGPLLHTVQMAELYNDSKHFVDMSIKTSPEQTLANFYKLMNATDKNPSKDENIVDPSLEEWGSQLVALWKELGRQTSTDVEDNPEKYSLIYLQHPVIRNILLGFLWTIEGLLLSEMYETAKGMLENFMELITNYGMVPNGGRIYYTRRSQPPYLIPMVKLYVDYTGDMDFVRKYIDVLVEEFNYWENNRSTPLRDINTGKIGSRKKRKKKNVELKSGAESGWDYSTRWFVNGDTNIGNLSDVNVTAIAPVDLNSLLCRNARILSEFYQQLGNSDKAAKFDEIATIKNQTLAELFWDEDDGIWYDFNIYTMKKRKYFYLSNVHPIWTDCYGIEGKKEETLTKVINYLNKKKVVDFIGGVPTSLRDSGEQWDFPNAWAPLEHPAILGLYNARDLNPDAEPLAFELAEKWIKTNYYGYQQTDAMYEKYDVTVLGGGGGGGEYEVVVGFGWTNGVAMKFLNTFGDRLTVTTGGASRPSSIMLLSLLSYFVINKIL
ncbi:Trehalase [Armadillidium vulgare]|nr:Trehalase [Armadillidium vulgare]